MADKSLIKSKFMRNLSFAAGATGVLGNALGYFVYGENKLRVSHNMAATESVQIHVRLEGDSEWTLLGTTTGAAAHTSEEFNIQSWDYVRFNVSLSAAGGTIIASAFFSQGGVENFIDLNDTPASFSGEALKIARVNAAEDSLEFVTPAAGVTTFLGLTDTPSAYTGAALKMVKVNATANGIEFVADSPTGGTFEQTFTSDTGFTYDATKAEFNSGTVRQVDKAPAGFMSWATFTNNINLNIGGGTLTGTGVGGATVAAGKLDLSYSDLRYVDYNANLNASSQQTGCIKYKLTPNYNGAPVTQQVIFLISKGSGVNNNSLFLTHKTDGNISIGINNLAGTPLFNVDLGIWSPTLGSTYEMELNYDITAGATRLFINGTQFGATQNTTGTRDSNIGLLRIGTSSNITLTSNFKIDDFIVFSTVQHTANYTPGYTLYEYRYLESSVVLPRFTYTGVGAIDALIDMSDVITGSPRYVFNGKYWDGAAWSTSSNTYATSASRASSLANFASLLMRDYWDIVVIFPDGNSISSLIDNLILTYSVAGIIAERTPSSGTDVGVKGSHVYDADFLYTCINTDTWRRIKMLEFTDVTTEQNVRTVDVTTLLDNTYNIVLCNKATAMTINLPTAASCTNRVYVIKNINVGTVTIDPDGAELIDGAGSKDIAVQWTSITIVSNGTSWFII